MIKFIPRHHHMFSTRCYHYLNFQHYNQQWPQGVMTPQGQIVESSKFQIFQVLKKQSCLWKAKCGLQRAHGSLYRALGSLQRAQVASGGLMAASGGPIVASGGPILASGGPILASGEPKVAS